MKKGINGRSFDANLPVAEAAKQARAAGFDAFEPSLAESGPLSLASDEPTCRAAGEAIRNAGLEITALTCDVHWNCSFTSPDSQERMRAREAAIALLDRAVWIGAPAVVIVPGVIGRPNEKAPRAKYGDALARSATALRELAPEGEARGLQIAIENVPGRFLLSPVEMRELIDQVNWPWVGACFNVGNVAPIGYPQDWIAVLGRRLVCVHVGDYKLDGANTGPCPLGEGDVDWPAVMTALQRAVYEGPLVYEGQGEPSDISARMARVIGAT